jgi:hypothetical protein
MEIPDNTTSSPTAPVNTTEAFAAEIESMVYLETKIFQLKLKAYVAQINQWHQKWPLLRRVAPDDIAVMLNLMRHVDHAIKAMAPKKDEPAKDGDDDGAAGRPSDR